MGRRNYAPKIASLEPAWVRNQLFVTLWNLK